MNWWLVFGITGWVVAAFGYFSYWLETQAHAENIRYQVDSYRRLKNMFEIYRRRNPEKRE